MNPFLATQDAVDQSYRHPKLRGDFRKRPSVSPQLLNFGNVGIFELRQRVSLSPSRSTPCGILGFAVSRSRQPSEVASAVVAAVPVDVINRRPVEVTGHESLGDKLVNVSADDGSLSLEDDARVTGRAGSIRLQQRASTQLRRLPGSPRRRGVVQRANIPSVRHFHLRQPDFDQTPLLVHERRLGEHGMERNLTRRRQAEAAVYRG